MKIQLNILESWATLLQEIFEHLKFPSNSHAVWVVFKWIHIRLDIPKKKTLSDSIKSIKLDFFFSMQQSCPITTTTAQGTEKSKKCLFCHFSSILFHSVLQLCVRQTTKPTIRQSLLGDLLICLVSGINEWNCPRAPTKQKLGEKTMKRLLWYSGSVLLGFSWVLRQKKSKTGIKISPETNATSSSDDDDISH